MAEWCCRMFEKREDFDVGRPVVRRVEYGRVAHATTGTYVLWRGRLVEMLEIEFKKEKRKKRISKNGNIFDVDRSAIHRVVHVLQRDFDVDQSVVRQVEYDWVVKALQKFVLGHCKTEKRQKKY